MFKVDVKNTTRKKNEEKSIHLSDDKIKLTTLLLLL